MPHGVESAPNSAAEDALELAQLSLGNDAEPRPEGAALSKNAVKRLAQAERKAVKLTMAREAATALCADHNLTRQVVAPSAGNVSAGKAGRAKAFALTGEEGASSAFLHRASGGEPVGVLPEHAALVDALERLETAARTRARPHLARRRPVNCDVHGTMDDWCPVSPASPHALPPTPGGEAPDALSGALALRSRGLFAFSVDALVASPSWGWVVALDLSRNSLSEVPGLDRLASLASLNLDRNWLSRLPPGLGRCLALTSVSAQHNMLKGCVDALEMRALATLTAQPVSSASSSSSSSSSCSSEVVPRKAFFASLDVQNNKMCCTQALLDALRLGLPGVAVRMTVTVTAGGASTEGAYVGESAADRDATLLRAQLEPWSTTALRRRLVADFGQDPALDLPRAGVMAALLECYREEDAAAAASVKAAEVGSPAPAVGLVSGGGGGGDGGSSLRLRRKTVFVAGAPVDPGVLAALLVELQAWAATTTATGKGRERPTIAAEKYMILTSPAEFQPGSKLSLKAVAKLHAHAKLWDLAVAALRPIDPAFAASFTALAVTHQFSGSPHIDKRNVGPFYGLALGSFAKANGGSGGGGIMVESSARVCVCVDTALRLGKVDGRYPHWVAPYNKAQEERYSLIYYQTAGDYIAPGPAVFSIPRHEE